MGLDGAAMAAMAAVFPSLQDLPRALHARLAAEGDAVAVPAGARLFEDGAPCSAFPLLLEGSVRVAKLAASGREILLYRVAAGEACVLSTGCLMGRRPYGATGVAETALRLARLPAALFDALLVGHAPFRQAVFGLLAARLEELMLLVEEVAFRRLDERLAALLVMRGPEIRATHQALAADIGTVREIVSRILSDFEERSFVALGRERITVTDAAALKRIALSRTPGASS